MTDVNFDGVHFYMNELTSRIIAKSGIPADRFHLGKIILQNLKDDPDFVMQIDGATGQSETNRSALERTVRCAISLRNLGVQQGDVMVIMSSNHIDIAVPYYAALYLGVIIAPVDTGSSMKELEQYFITNKPKIIFCKKNRTSDVNKLLVDNNFVQVISFDGDSEFLSLSQLIETHGGTNEIEDFRPTDFDPEQTIACLMSTSGTTGVPKTAALTHKNLAISISYLWLGFTNFPKPTRMAMMLSPLQWLSATFNMLFSPILKYIRLQTSQPVTKDHVYHLINTYKPTYALISPTLMTTLMNPSDREQCDFTCLQTLILAGSPVSLKLMQEVKKVTPDTKIRNRYGLSELGGFAFHVDCSPPRSVGRPMGCFEYRLVKIDTHEDIHEPNIPGELWLRGPTIFQGYYNNPEATAEIFTADGWLKTGDILYRDEHWNFYFDERLKLLLKYCNYQISPTELEDTIRQHPGVLDVAVTGIPDPECGDLPVACVVTRPGFKITAQDIKNLVKETLADSKQLRGGVIFLPELPTTITTKVHRRKLKEMALSMIKE